MTAFLAQGLQTAETAPTAAPSAPASSQPQPQPRSNKPPPSRIRQAQALRAPSVLEAQDDTAEAAPPALTAAELAGAVTAESGPRGSGGGPEGGACNMAKALQDALRRDPLVQAAAAASGGRALRVWNGDWLRSAGEDGKGLAAVREAIMWGVAFAPANCRAAPVHGLVLLSLNDGARLVVGGGDWRWSDLLALHREG
jgi:hypothetical protein